MLVNVGCFSFRCAPFAGKRPRGREKRSALSLVPSVSLDSEGGRALVAIHGGHPVSFSPGKRSGGAWFATRRTPRPKAARRGRRAITAMMRNEPGRPVRGRASPCWFLGRAFLRSRRLPLRRRGAPTSSSRSGSGRPAPRPAALAAAPAARAGGASSFQAAPRSATAGGGSLPVSSVARADRAPSSR